ncbi:MAG: MFS transporter [Nitrososphaerales archaeon]
MTDQGEKQSQDFFDIPKETWVVFSIRTINSLGFSATMPFLAVYLLTVRNVPYSLIGVLYLVTGTLGIASQILGGRLTDSIGPKKIMLTGYIFSFGSSLILGYFVLIDASVFTFFVFYPIFSFLRGISQPASSSIIAGQKASKVRNGFSLLNIGGNLGFAIGPAIAGPIIDIYNYSTVFLLSAGTSLAAALIALAWIEGGRRYEVESSPNVKEQSAVRRWLSWKQDRNVITFLILTFVLTVANGYEITPLSLYVAGFLNFSNGLIGLLFATNGAVIVLLQLPLTRLMERTGKLLTPLVFSAGFMVGAYILAGFSTTFPEFEVVMFIVTLGEIFLTVPAQTTISLFSNAGNRGTYQGFYSAASNTGRSVASFVGPTSFQLLAFEPQIAWYSIAGVALVTGVAFALLSPGLERDYEKIRYAL